MSGRDPKAPIPAGFKCPYAEPGQRACHPAICDCFIATHPDDPFGLHPEAFVVLKPAPGSGTPDGGGSGQSDPRGSGQSDPEQNHE